MSDRLHAIVDAMRIRADDRVLEIGCGHGVAASLICERLRGGRLLAIDRSRKMIEAAQRRNAAYVADGRAAFAVAALEDFDAGEARFDKILAVRVGLFHRRPAQARVLAARWLAPGGRLFVTYDAPKPTRG